MSVEELERRDRGRHIGVGDDLGPRFRLLLAGQVVSQIGDRMAYLTIPLYLMMLTDSEFQVGIAYALENAPVLIIGFVGGVLLDRVRARPLMIAADVARALLFLALALTAGDDGNLARRLVVFAVAFSVGGLTHLFEAGLMKIVPDLVSERTLPRANAWVSGSVNLGNTTGPALAGALVLVTNGNFGIVFAIDAFTFLVSAATLVAIGPLPTATLQIHTGFRSELATGLRYVWNEARLRSTTIAVAIANLVVGFIEATLVFTAQDPDLVGADGAGQLGLLYSVFGLGAIVGMFVAPRIVAWFGLGRTMVTGLIGFAIAWILFVDTSFSVLGSVYLFATTVMLMLINIPVVTIRQVYTPGVLRGRVISASRAIGFTTLPVGAIVGTAIAEVTDSFEVMIRSSTVVVLAVGLALMPTIIWRDTFGPGSGRRQRPTTGRKVIELR